MERSKLEEALQEGEGPGNDLAETLLALGDCAVTTTAEAEAICAALDRLDEAPAAMPPGLEAGAQDPELAATPLRLLASLFQRVREPEAFDVLAERGMPRLLAHYRARLGASRRNREDLLFLLKVFAMYPSEEGVEEIASAARRGLWAEDFLWETILQQFDGEHPHRLLLCDKLRDPLPRGFTAIAFLDFANGLTIGGDVEEHPFDSPVGKALLEGYLTDGDPERYSFAHSATAALPFVSRPERDRLLALALDHPDERVQLEGAWASAMLGSEGGLKLLKHRCLDPRYNGIARAYLAELEREDAVPPEAFEPSLVARAELCMWLAHPGEFGRVPDEVEVFDRRRMYWPPSDDERELWLIRYRYAPREPEGKEEVGVGLVGSIPFCLNGEVTPETSPDDAYALHCCWELEVNGDPRAPETRSVEAGRAILAAGPGQTA